MFYGYGLCLIFHRLCVDYVSTVVEFYYLFYCHCSAFARIRSSLCRKAWWGQTGVFIVNRESSSGLLVEIRRYFNEFHMRQDADEIK